MKPNILIAASIVLPLVAGTAGAAEVYEPVHDSTAAASNVSLKNLPTYGPLTPGMVAIVKITGEGGPGGIGPVVVKNDSGFDITDLHWKIPAAADIRGKKVVGENDVPNNWNQPDVQFGDKNNNGQAGESNIFKKITPKGAGPGKELIFADGVIKNGTNFTDGKIPQGAGKITEHYALVSYSTESKASGLSSAGKSGKTLTFDGPSGVLSLSPFALTSAYITNLLDVLDINKVDSIFNGDPLLGATLSVSPFVLQYKYDENGIDKFYFASPNGVLTIVQGATTLLTASVDSGMVFDPTQKVSFFAPLTNLSLNNTLGSSFLAQMQSSLQDPAALSFDLFIRPDSDFLQSTFGFEASFAASADAGIAQNGHGQIPAPLSLPLFLTGFIALGLRIQIRSRALQRPQQPL